MFGYNRAALTEMNARWIKEVTVTYELNGERVKQRFDLSTWKHKPTYKELLEILKKKGYEKPWIERLTWSRWEL